MQRQKYTCNRGRIVAEYDALSKKVTQMHTLQEMVLPEDELKIYNEPLEVRLEATNQQLKKLLLRWKPVANHSMKKVKEMAQTRTKPIWRHFTADKPAKTNVSIRLPARQHAIPKKMSNNPLMNVFKRTKTSKSTSKALPTTKPITKPDDLISKDVHNNRAEPINK
jgi:hypothetical protein